ncbi:MAG: hypothetical protein NW217_02185 [Hyphomicrobiaceae bacterium]|nr:hypothetical protein [Hyphomicrobiaceae bacterium]
MRKLVSSIVCLSLATGPFASVGYAQAPMTRAEQEACAAKDEAEFASAIEAVTIRALESDLSGVDYKAIVADQWRKESLDSVIDARVDIAVADVREKTGWGTLLQSLASSEQAQKLATEVAERTYRSDVVTGGIERLAVGVSTVVGSSIEQASRVAAVPALKCLQAYLGPRYGSTISEIVGGEASRDFAVEAGKGNEIGPGSVAAQSTEGLAGAAILLVRRQLGNLARTVGARIVGSVLSRLVSVVAGGVGLVLIAKDVWDLRHGVLPIIAQEMKSEATKLKVQEELAVGISEQIKLHVREIGQQSAGRVVAVWRQFQAAHLKALEIAERNEPFRKFLNGVGPEKLGRLDEVVSIVLPAEGEAGLLRRLEDGSLNTAVRSLSEPAMAIARSTQSIEAALKWAAIAGTRTNDVVENGIHLVAKPEDFTTAALGRVLASGERIAITRLASVSREARETLFEIDDTTLKSLARSLTAEELGQLARYLTGLSAKPREAVLRAVAQSPGKMQLIASDRVRGAVLASADQTAAVEMMLRTSGAFDPVVTWGDIKHAWQGDISPILIVEKHPIALSVVGGGLLVLMLMVLRLFSAPRAARPQQSRLAAGDAEQAPRGG